MTLEKDGKTMQEHDDEPAPLQPGAKLVLGYDYSDNGDGRPLPYGTVFYCSPFIALSTADPVTGWIPPDTPAILTATVQNLSGLGAALGTKLNFYYARPSLGALTDVTWIGESKPKSLPPGAAEIMECTTPWTPTLDFGTHQCLLVHAESLEEKVEFPWRADLDRRVGQRNLVVDPPGTAGTKILTVTNPFAFDAVTWLVQHSWRISGLTPQVTHALGTTLADLCSHVADPKRRRLLLRHDVEVSVGEPVGIHFEGFGSDEPFELFDDRTVEQLLRRRGENSGGHVLAETALPPGSKRDTVFHVASPDDGATYVHQLTQVIGGIEIGGYTVLAVSD
ncbi:hypothetical protein [Nocardia sp. CS682]|uniref:hypothetical protein n=1 Tax=Nocardia sp. CS682 TaxID=1047172 RepID=UPI001074D7DE|nr:hypothetical protein [Nocardia sp. CS682]QBS38830.1 hypothetical protein DMB37_00565 [Nocardia sp. CS682]